MRTEAGLLPCPACAALAEPRHGECGRCAEPLFTTNCTSCRETVFAGHAFCMHCGTGTHPHAPPRPDSWAEGTPLPGPTAPFAKVDADTLDRDDDVPTRVRVDGSGPNRRLAVRPSRGACPRCGGPFVQRTLGGLDLDECHRCGAMFVELAELTRLVFDPATAIALVPGLLARASMHPTKGGMLGGCPVCRGRLHVRALATPAGRTAVCKQHGAWFEPAALAAASRELADGVLAGGERERAAFRDDVRHGRYEALLAHARALRGRAPGRFGPLSLLAELIA